MKTEKLLTITFFVFLSSGIFCQSERKIKGLFEDYMLSVENNTQKPDISSVYNNEKNLGIVGKVASGYCSDTNYEVRSEAYNLVYIVALKSKKPETRQNSVFTLVKGINDKNKSISGWAVTHLSVFNRDDFNPKSKSIITSALNKRIPNKNELIKIAGYLNLQEAKNSLINIAANSQNIPDKWAAYLALARMGEQAYIDKINAIVNKYELNNDVVYEAIPGLIYTRQKDCFGYVIEALNNRKKLCMSPDPDNPERIPCGYRIMEYLAPVIEGFPYEIKASGDLKTENHKEALTKTREWFRDKGSNFKISDSTF